MNDRPYEYLLELLSKQNERLDLLEKVFHRLMTFDLRLETLEFNSNLPVRPPIIERLNIIELQLLDLMPLLNKED